LPRIGGIPIKLYLEGHSYKYALEQMLLVLFPEERPVYPGQSPAEKEDHIRSVIRRGPVWATARTTIVRDGKQYSRFARAPVSELSGKLAADRALQRILKLSFFKAARDCTGAQPPWGALTGIRPAKIVARLLEQGGSVREADALLKNVYFVSPARRQLCIDAAQAELAVKHSLSPDEISLYVGIPFCPTRCAYCSFVSHSVEKSLRLVDPFLDLLAEEIKAAGEAIRAAGRRIRPVYIGGGTPTTLSAEQLGALLGRMQEHLDLSGCTEFTVEAGRPDTITKEKLAALRKYKVDRVSVNPQSMREEVLQAIGRRHSAEDTEQAVALVREAGFRHLNMDLIAGLPADSEAGFRSSTERVLSFRPENVTVHTLALKKGSRLMLEKGTLPGPETVGKMLETAEAALRAAGYRPYYLYRQKFMSGNFENVGWCLPGSECYYNICMMEELHTILSLGGGGVTKLVNAETGQISRVCNAKYPYEYIGSREKILEGKGALLSFHTAPEQINQ
jgi:oxygen-independent coproporphyrinogen-3 oxidase